jgi:dihydroxyacetone kinase phosphotransfer subunit
MTTVGIVLVSHSPVLAEAAVALALEMSPGSASTIAIAAGAADGVIGTDATKVAAALARVASPAGILVLMDLGSAVLSAELALELAGDLGTRVILSSAPFVEGLMAAVVRAAGGASLDEVAREALHALDGKSSQLAPAPLTEVEPGLSADPAPPDHPAGFHSASFVVANADGLHARPAAVIVAALRGIDAVVRVSTAIKGPVDARSPIGLMTLGARQGDEVTVTAEGQNAEEAIATIVALAADSFGDGPVSAD